MNPDVAQVISYGVGLVGVGVGIYNRVRFSILKADHDFIDRGHSAEIKRLEKLISLEKEETKSARYSYQKLMDENVKLLSDNAALFSKLLMHDQVIESLTDVRSYRIRKCHNNFLGPNLTPEEIRSLF